MRPHEAWLYYADQDLLFAQSAMRGGFFAYVCFLAQQAVEKTIKAYLVVNEIEFPKTHGLLFLYELMKVQWLDEHQVALKKLSELYVSSRYPDAIVGMLPEGLPDQQDAEHAMQWAEGIVAKIQEHIK